MIERKLLFVFLSIHSERLPNAVLFDAIASFDQLLF